MLYICFFFFSPAQRGHLSVLINPIIHPVIIYYQVNTMVSKKECAEFNTTQQTTTKASALALE